MILSLCTIAKARDCGMLRKLLSHCAARSQSPEAMRHVLCVVISLRITMEPEHFAAFPREACCPGRGPVAALSSGWSVWRGDHHSLDPRGLAHMLALLAGLSDGMRSEVDDTEGHPDVIEPPSKRHRVMPDMEAKKYQSKIGCGVLGVPLEEVAGNDKMCRCCSFCGNAMGSPDPVFPERTRSWHKPHQAGLICAYCGVAKGKLHPNRDAKFVLNLIQSQQEEQQRFLNYAEMLISMYQNGSRAVKNLGDGRPRETVTKASSTDVKLRVRGKAKLLEHYPWGDPTQNGLGHTVTKTKWKDGTWRDVVIIPETAEDEMEITWDNTTQLQHTTELHDGTLTESPNQVRDLLNQLREEQGKCMVKGEASSSLSAAPASKSSAAMDNDGNGKASNSTMKGDGNDSDLDLEGDDGARPANDDLFGMLMGGPAGSGAGLGLPSAASGGCGPKAKAKNTSKAKATPASSAAPPPLPGCVRAAGEKQKKSNIDAVGAGELDSKSEQLILSKVEKIAIEYKNSQKASLVAMLEKKYYKKLKAVMDDIDMKLVKARSKSVSERLTIGRKTLDILIKIGKAYKQWVKKSDNAEFLNEYKVQLEFAAEQPIVDIEIPQRLGR